MNLFFEDSPSYESGGDFHSDRSGCPAVSGVIRVIPFLPVSPGAAAVLDKAGSTVLSSGWKAIGGMVEAILSDPGLTCMAMSKIEAHRLEMDPIGALCSIDGSSLAAEAMETMAANPHLRKVAAIQEFGNYIEHSRSVSMASAIIGEEMGLEPVWIERLRIAGLLHDIGTLAIFTLESLMSENHEAAARFLISRNPALLGILRHRGKHTCFGENTHLMLGESMVEEWGFPKYLAGSIRHHHNPLENGGCDMSAVIFLANFMVLEFEGLKWETLFNPKLLQMVGLDGRKISLARRRIIAYIHSKNKAMSGRLFNGSGRAHSRRTGLPESVPLLSHAPGGDSFW